MKPMPLTAEQVRAVCARLGITKRYEPPTKFNAPKETSTLNTPSQRSMVCNCGKPAIYQSGFGDECQECFEARHRRYQMRANKRKPIKDPLLP